MPSDAENEDKDIGTVKMPWPVRIVLCWFVLLTGGSHTGIAIPCLTWGVSAWRC